MGPTPFYGARAKKTQKADFAMKQTNICRLSGDITSSQVEVNKDNRTTHGHRTLADGKCFLSLIKCVFEYQHCELVRSQQTIGYQSTKI